MSQPKIQRPGIGILISTLVGTVYLALLITLSTRGGWLGYAAGLGDHNVLMPVGIRAAIPEAFKNDWFINAAPQPHWFFDLVIQGAVLTGTVDAVLFAYWLIGIAAFALATVLLARLLAPSHPLLTPAIILTLAGLAPWGLFGTGSGTIGMALPTVLAGNLIYLAIVLLIRENFKSAAILGLTIAIIHVQQGAIIAIVFAVTLIVQWFVQRKIIFPLAIGLFGTGALVTFGLLLRPVAANPGDFVEVCNTIIPYHCSVSMWHWSTQLAAIGGFLAASLTVLALRSAQRLLWASTVGLVILGYALGFVADALRLPIFGDLAQSVNANRLGSIIVPFMFWGMIFPLLKLRAPARFQSPKGVIWAFWGIWAAVTAMTLIDPTWKVLHFAVHYRGLFLIIGALCVVLTIAAARWRRDFMPWPPVTAVVVVCLASAIVGGTIQPKPSLNWYQRGDPTAAQSWYREVGRVVPSGGIITAPGSSDSLRLYSQRATIVDCKNVPYGGQAWLEWKERTRDLGIDCKTRATYSPDATPESLELVARKYGSEYVVVEPAFAERYQAEISANSWTLALGPSGPLAWYLYQLPER